MTNMTRITRLACKDDAIPTLQSQQGGERVLNASVDGIQRDRLQSLEQMRAPLNRRPICGVDVVLVKGPRP